MSRGVVYWNHGTRCLVRFLVSAVSLRKHYHGPASLLHEGALPDWVARACKKLDVDLIELPVCHDYGLCKKSRLWRVVPYQQTMLIDTDTVVCGPIDEFLEEIGNGHVVVTAFSEWGTSKGRMVRRIKGWDQAAPELIKSATLYGHAINTGVQGWPQGAELLPAYEALTQRGWDTKMQRKTLDEIAMQLLVPKYPHKLMPERWNCSCIYGNLKDAVIVHYHGHKHCRPGPGGDIWAKAFWAMLDRLPELRERILKDPLDGSVKVWLKESQRPKAHRKDITVVTAVNPQYAEVAKRNFELWAKLPGLKEQNFLVFVNGFARAKERNFVTELLPNCRVVRWTYEGKTPRETMLAAFVLGVPKEVKTPYWMKLDADTKPVADEFEWPQYNKSTITSHKWGYTKLKGEKDPPDHWFNRLDGIFANGSPLFKRTLDPVKDFRVSHRNGNPDGIPMRFGSFAHIEKTEFTARIARAVEKKCGGKLPIPSQDTLSWYCATLWKEKVQLVNMKGTFQP